MSHEMDNGKDFGNAKFFYYYMNSCAQAL